MLSPQLPLTPLLQLWAWKLRRLTSHASCFCIKFREPDLKWMAVNLFQQVPVSVLTSEKPFFPAVSLLRLLTEEKALKCSLIYSFYSNKHQVHWGRK